MLTARGLWLLLTTLCLLGWSLWRDVPALTLALVSLTVLLWFLVSWLSFVIRLRLLTGKLRVARQVRDQHGPVQSLWAAQRYHVRVRLMSEGALLSPYLRVTDRVPLGAQHLHGEAVAEGSVAADKPLQIAYQFSSPGPGVIRFEGVAVQAADPQGLFY